MLMVLDESDDSEVLRWRPLKDSVLLRVPTMPRFCFDMVGFGVEW
jgi:hypothetical protein